MLMSLLRWIGKAVLVVAFLAACAVVSCWTYRRGAGRRLRRGRKAMGPGDEDVPTRRRRGCMPRLRRRARHLGRPYLTCFFATFRTVPAAAERAFTCRDSWSSVFMMSSLVTRS